VTHGIFSKPDVFLGSYKKVYTTDTIDGKRDMALRPTVIDLKYAKKLNR